MSNCNYNSRQHYNTNISNNYSNTCNTNTSSAFPTNYLYGHAYTPIQTLNQTFTPQVGLQNGTIFPELVSPYSPGQSMDFINFLRNGGTQNG